MNDTKKPAESHPGVIAVMMLIGVVVVARLLGWW